jgi:GrpB-like predicted nucleotidyltransferase (UPF0157 family)
MAGLLDDALEWMQSPERTQQLQQVKRSMNDNLEMEFRDYLAKKDF